VMTFPPRSIELTFMAGDPEHFEPLQLGKDFGLFRVKHASAHE
jgi:hypothetical protein